MSIDSSVFMHKVIDKYHEEHEKLVKEQLLKHFGTLDMDFLKARVEVKSYPTVDELYDGETLIFKISKIPTFK